MTLTKSLMAKKKSNEEDHNSNILRWFRVCCRDVSQKTYELNVMARDKFSAEHCAAHALLEQENTEAKPISCEEVP